MVTAQFTADAGFIDSAATPVNVTVTGDPDTVPNPGGGTGSLGGLTGLFSVAWAADPIRLVGPSRKARGPIVFRVRRGRFEEAHHARPAPVTCVYRSCTVSTCGAAKIYLSRHPQALSREGTSRHVAMGKVATRSE